MRIAVVAGPAPGHAFPSTALALRLRAAGHEVVVANGTQWEGAIVAAGLDFVELPLLAPSSRDHDFGYRMWGRPVEMAPALAAVLGGLGLDLVVADTLTTVGGYAAGMLDLPWVELVPHPLQDPSVALPPPGMGRRPARGPLGRRHDAWLRGKHAQSRLLADAARREGRLSLGLPADGPPRLRLVATLPCLEPARPDWPERTFVVGPLEWDPASRDLEVPPGEDPLVVVSASTAVVDGPDLFSLALQGLSGVRLACTRLSAYDEDLPSWAVAGPGRQGPLLDRAAVLVSGAGHGIVAKALVRGVPLVMVPGPGEQKDNALRVVGLGAGESVTPRKLTPHRLRDAVERVVADPAYRQAALRAGATASEVADPVALVESLA